MVKGEVKMSIDEKIAALKSRKVEVDAKYKEAEKEYGKWDKLMDKYSEECDKIEEEIGKLKVRNCKTFTVGDIVAFIREDLVRYGQIIEIEFNDNGYTYEVTELTKDLTKQRYDGGYTQRHTFRAKEVKRFMTKAQHEAHCAQKEWEEKYREEKRIDRTNKKFEAIQSV